MIRRLLLLSIGIMAIALSACGERPQVVQYKQGTYAGKPDQPPFSGAPWNGDQAQWMNAIHTRNQRQNEYKRTN